MVATVQIALGDASITVRELTVAEVRDWALKVDQGLIQVDPVREYVFEDVSLDDLLRMSDADGDVLEQYGPSDLQPVAEAARKLNPHFFRLRAELVLTARLMAREAGLPVQ